MRGFFLLLQILLIFLFFIRMVALKNYYISTFKKDIYLQLGAVAIDHKITRRTVEALLEEYTNVVIALQKVITKLSYANLTTIVDSTTKDANCQSIQTILTHVISSGYSYVGYIRRLKKIADNRPGKLAKMSSEEYHSDLNHLILYTIETFESIHDHELEEFDEDKKIKTSWGQVYDIEQMMEHAVIHVLSHRRKIEKFKSKLELIEGRQA